MEVIESEGNLVARADELGETDARRSRWTWQKKHPVIGQVRGLGPMLAIELVKDPQTKEPAPELAKQVTSYCHKHGLLILDCGTLGNNIRTLMPLTISNEQLDKGLSIMSDALDNIK